jgi:hypothetical protein
VDGAASPLTGASPSRIGSTSMLSCRLAPVIATASGSPSAVNSRWYFVPALPRSVGFGPVSSPLSCPDAHRVQGRPRPVQQPFLAELIQYGVVELLPHSGRLPGPAAGASR